MEKAQGWASRHKIGESISHNPTAAHLTPSPLTTSPSTPDSSCLALEATLLHNSKVDCSKLEKAVFMEPAMFSESYKLTN